MHLRLAGTPFPPALGYGVRLEDGRVFVELLSVHEALETTVVPAYLYPGRVEIALLWPGYRPGVYLRQHLRRIDADSPRDSS